MDRKKVTINAYVASITLFAVVEERKFEQGEGRLSDSHGTYADKYAYDIDQKQLQLKSLKSQELSVGYVILQGFVSTYRILGLKPWHWHYWIYKKILLT